MQGHCLAVQQQCLQPGACAGAKRVFWHTIKNLHTHRHKEQQQQQKSDEDTQTHIYTHIHVQPSGPDQYMTRVNLLRTSGSPIKGLGVLIGDHRSHGETNNDVNPQQQHNGPDSLGLWEWKRGVIQA